MQEPIYQWPMDGTQTTICHCQRSDVFRRRVHLLHPDLGNFLFASVGEEIEGVPLSVISALTRLGLDPWEEAVRLSSLNRSEAAEQLARLIVELPGNCHPLTKAREIARPLVVLLPRRGTMPRVVSQIQVRPRYYRLAASLRRLIGLFSVF